MRVALLSSRRCLEVRYWMKTYPIWATSFTNQLNLSGVNEELEENTERDTKMHRNQSWDPEVHCPWMVDK